MADLANQLMNQADADLVVTEMSLVSTRETLRERTKCRLDILRQLKECM